jgi:hypothetical protein
MNIFNPTEKDVEEARAKGYEVKTVENLGMGEIGSCENDEYELESADALVLDEKYMTATLLFL